MAFHKTSLVIFVLMVSVWGVAKAAVYQVGDSVGWNSMGDFDYQNWAAAKNFHVGDILVFNYNHFHMVKQVSLRDFKSCDGTSPIALYTWGNDAVTLENEGHYYFICGYPGDCQSGHKVDILVAPPSSPPPPELLPLASPSSYASPPELAASPSKYTSPPELSSLLSPAPSNFASLSRSFSKILIAFIIIPWFFI